MDKKPHFWECKCGTRDIGDLSKEHPWHIENSKYNNCFWSYIYYNDRPHTLNEIATLMSLSISAITAIERKALVKLKKKLNQLQNSKKN